MIPSSTFVWFEFTYFANNMRKNKLNLTLPPIKPLTESNDDLQPDLTIELLQRTLEGLELNAQQRNRLERFWDQKQLVGTLHSLDELEDLGELGTGNGGVVSKMKHKKSGAVMAKKVRLLLYPRYFNLDPFLRSLSD